MPDTWKPITGLDELTQSSSTAQLQAGKPNYGQLSGTKRCTLCGALIPREFFRVNLQVACSTCAGAARMGAPIQGRSSYSQGLVFGIAAAAVGLVFYASFTIFTHFYFGWVALGVGWLVGKAILKGSNGVGGRPYQVTAAILTYAAISLAAIPIRITEQASAVDFSLGSQVVPLLVSGLLSPFLELFSGFGGVIGLVILFVGIRIAWRITAARPLKVDGPHIVLG